MILCYCADILFYSILEYLIKAIHALVELVEVPFRILKMHIRMEGPVLNLFYPCFTLASA